MYRCGMFSDLGEEWFDDYWMNYGKITITDDDGNTKKIRNLKDFVICQDFKETLKEISEDDFIYCDPPYVGRHVVKDVICDNP